jgi:hypothetical protein
VGDREEVVVRIPVTPSSAKDFDVLSVGYEPPRTTWKLIGPLPKSRLGFFTSEHPLRPIWSFFRLLKFGGFSKECVQKRLSGEGLHAKTK